MASLKVKVSFPASMLESRGLVKLGIFYGEDLAISSWWGSLAAKIAVSGVQWCLIYLFVSVAMYSTKSIITKISSFSSKLIHHEERTKSSPENITNFTKPLASNIEAGNYTFTFKEATSQPDKLDLVDATRKK